MKVTISSHSEEYVEENCSDAVELKFDDVVVFSVHDGEREDNNLSRNFNACFSLEALVNRAYSAGVNGEDLTIEYGTVDE